MALDPDAFAAYVVNRLSDVSEVEVSGVDRIHGGASRETYRLRLAYTRDGQRFERPLILRKDPPASLIETERDTEFAAYSAFYGTRVPVPEALWLENDPVWLADTSCWCRCDTSDRREV